MGTRVSNALAKFAGALLAVCFATGALAEADCRADRIDLKGRWGSASFTVETADTPASRSMGLMYRTEMDTDAGMLFIYEAPAQVAFWMKNTLIPLDMIFADSTGTVTKVHANAIPGDLRAIPGSAQTQFVLEINGGLAAELGITPGTLMRHPGLGRFVAWPC
jgi:uncharacterized membrane protein (UPF0127 family)